MDYYGIYFEKSIHAAKNNVYHFREGWNIVHMYMNSHYIYEYIYQRYDIVMIFLYGFIG